MKRKTKHKTMRLSFLKLESFDYSQIKEVWFNIANNTFTVGPGFAKGGNLRTNCTNYTMSLVCVRLIFSCETWAESCVRQQKTCCMKAVEACRVFSGSFWLSISIEASLKPILTDFKYSTSKTMRASNIHCNVNTF